MFVRKDGTPNIRRYQKKVSTVFAKGMFCAVDSNGFLIPATSATTVAAKMGIIQKDVLATDTDYAVATYVEVDVPIVLYDWFIADVGAGTPAQANVNARYNLVDSNNVDLTTQTIGNVKVEQIFGDGRVVVTIV